MYHMFHVIKPTSGTLFINILREKIYVCNIKMLIITIEILMFYNV
jgi:hypothetical protein